VPSVDVIGVEQYCAQAGALQAAHDSNITVSFFKKLFFIELKYKFD
jgi:hypothetical protein